MAGGEPLVPEKCLNHQGLHPTGTKKHVGVSLRLSGNSPWSIPSLSLSGCLAVICLLIYKMADILVPMSRSYYKDLMTLIKPCLAPRKHLIYVTHYYCCCLGSFFLTSSVIIFINNLF